MNNNVQSNFPDFKSKFLVLLSCSNHKKEKGSQFYDVKSSVQNLLKKTKGDDLLQLRELALSYIEDGSFDRDGKLLKEYPYNNDLAHGPDFNGKDKAIYLPVYKRYSGRFYREIEGSNWLSRNRNVVIVSSLYGLLLPEENIQRYSLTVGDSSLISDIWHTELTPFILEIAKKLKVNYIIDGMADPEYIDLFDWNEIKTEFGVVRIKGEQNEGPSLLESIGSFFSEVGFGISDSELEKLIFEKKKYKTKYEEIVFIHEKSTEENEVFKVSESSAEYITLLQVNLPDFSEAILQEAKTEYGIKNIEIVFSMKVFMKLVNMAKEIIAKVPKAITLYVTDPNHPSLKTRIIRNHDPKIVRCRIDNKYRIHFNLWDSEHKLLYVRDIGGHRLEGIGD